MSETDLEQWYELLAIAPGASLAELEVAYRQQRYRLSREGSELQREQLKTAYCHLKAHLETPTSEPTWPDQPSVTGPQERVELPPGLGVGESPQEWVDLPPDASPGQQEILSARNREVGADPATVSDPLVALLQAKLKAQDLKLQVKRKGTQVLVLLAAAQVPEPEPLIRGLERELRELELPGVEVAKVYALRHWGRASSPVVWRRELQLQVLPEPERSEDLRAIASQRFSFQNLPVNALAFPLATLLALGLNASLIQILLLPWQIWIHEFGHATVAWLGGRRATPLPFGWTNYTFERSLFVYFGILILLGLLFRAGWQENLRWPRVLAVGIAILQFIFTWLLPQRAIELLITFGGNWRRILFEYLPDGVFLLPISRSLALGFLAVSCPGDCGQYFLEKLLALAPDSTGTRSDSLGNFTLRPGGCRWGYESTELGLWLEGRANYSDLHSVGSSLSAGFAWGLSDATVEAVAAPLELGETKAEILKLRDRGRSHSSSSNPDSMMEPAF